MLTVSGAQTRPTRSVAFLRAINVVGRRANSAQLVAAFSGLGLRSVETFLASGNVLFEPDRNVVDRDGPMVLEAALGYPVQVTTRTAEELIALAAAEPFSELALAASTGKPQVILLFDSPTALARSSVLDLDTNDVFVFDDRALHWLPAAGVAGSDPLIRKVSRLVGLNTIRTGRTISRLVAKL
jgi:uncharacterized protein (DUF1697 family)